LRKSPEFRFKNLVQFGAGFSCLEAPGKFDASQIHFMLGDPQELSAEMSGFKFRKLAEFHLKHLVQFAAGFRCHEAPGKSDAS
jgi:hypothetical protein